MAGEIHRGLDDILCALREEEGQRHDDTRAEEEDIGRLGGEVIRAHEVGVVGPIPVCHVVLIGGETRERYPDEVHEVITSEGQREGQRTGQDDDLEDIHAAPVQDLHDDREADEAADDELQCVAVDPVLVGEGRLLEPLDEHEVDDRGQRDAPEDTSEVGESLLIVEGEAHTCDPLHHRAKEEGHSYREEDSDDDL